MRQQAVKAVRERLAGTGRVQFALVRPLDHVVKRSAQPTTVPRRHDR